jgi:hypothetical protein
MLFQFSMKHQLERLRVFCVCVALTFLVSEASVARDQIFERNGRLAIQVTTLVSEPDSLDQLEANSMLTSGRLLNQYIRKKAAELCPGETIHPVSAKALSVQVVNNQMTNDPSGQEQYLYEILVDQGELDAMLKKSCLVL